MLSWRSANPSHSGPQTAATRAVTASTSSHEWMGASKLNRPSSPRSTSRAGPSSAGSSSTVPGNVSLTSRYCTGSGGLSTGDPS